MSILRAAAAAAFVTLAAATAALAHGSIAVTDAYARFIPGGKSGAVFLVIKNDGHEDDVLVSATADVAGKVELHTHVQAADGTMQMVPVEGGFPVPAGGSHELARGADHIMLMMLTSQPAQGDTIELKLTFEKAGEMTVAVPVDNDR